jgi:hypothetical protein
MGGSPPESEWIPTAKISLKHKDAYSGYPCPSNIFINDDNTHATGFDQSEI